MSIKISYIAKDTKIWENKFFMCETKDACEDISTLAYVFYYNYQRI